MSADLLRKAAALMRERAEAVARFVEVEGWWQAEVLFDAFAVYAGDDESAVPGAKQDAEHIAGMHPAVALAVADWLDLVAEDCEYDDSPAYVSAALTVARAYLGEQP